MVTLAIGVLSFVVVGLLLGGVWSAPFSATATGHFT